MFKTYKLEISKNQNKFNLVITPENENKAKEDLHKEGYNILSVKEILPEQLI